jgi:small subunit ribosomal protein S20
MPNSKQAAKRQAQNVIRRDSNKTVRSAMKTAVRKVLRAPTKEEGAKHLPDAMKRVDKAAKKSVIHANAAARKKSQLARAVGKLG